MSVSDSGISPITFQDAEATIHAIHRGAVDALVVVTDLEGPQVVMLQGAEEPYRVLVERMSDGALTVGSDGVILYVNSRLSELTGYSAEQLVGRNFATLFDSDSPTLSPEVSIEASLLRRDTASVPVAIWSRSIPFGNATATLVRLTDLSIHRRAEQIAAAERFARSILEHATEAIVVLASDGRITRASGKAELLAGRSPVGLTFSEAFPVKIRREQQSGTLARFSAKALNTLLASRPFHGVEVGLQREGLTDCVFLLSAGPLLDEARVSTGSIVTLTDITEQKRAEERQAMLIAELNHRVKNILAVIQAMAFKTMRSSDTLDQFNDTFSGRLKALALAHDVLTQTQWAGTDLHDLITAILKPHRPANHERTIIHGPTVLLPATATVPLSMTLHELTTNAVKYGGLSTPTGRIEITWNLTGNGGDQSIELIWKERGGPRVERKAASGFGTALIDRVVKSDLGGSSNIDFDPAGVCWTIRFHPTASGAQRERQDSPPTLGDVLYAKSKALVPERDWVMLVQSIAAGDQLALHALYERAHRLVFTLIMRITGNRETAEELTVDVFHDVWRRASSYDAANGTVLGWIMNQARSRAIDRLRFESRKKRSYDLDLEPPAEAAADPSDLLELHEQSDSLHAALAVLTPDERKAIEATFIDGLTHAEAAARLNQPLGTIKSRIRSALQKLRDALTAEAGKHD